MAIAQRINGWTRRVPAWPVYVAGGLWGIWYFWLALSGAWIDPVAELEHRIGLLALKFLLAGLAITPLRDLTRVNLVKYRRALGVTAFFLVVYHLLVWALLDVQTLGRVLADIAKRPYITIGMTGLALMLPLAVTSNNLAVRRLGPLRWRRLHRLVYPLVLLGAAHFVMVRKGWQIEPLVYLALAVLLLLMRIRWLRIAQTMLQRGSAARGVH